MGNQAHAGEPIRRAVELVRAGVIGPVHEVHAWTNRPIWPQGQAALDQRQELADKPKPAGLDWDLWLGPAPDRPFNGCYVPFRWRGWWDFGTGALGDMACHIVDMAYWALDLGWPTSIQAESDGLTDETGPLWSTITYQFPARSSVGGGELGGAVGPRAVVEQPPVKFVWYDGNRDGRQNAPYELLQQALEQAADDGDGLPGDSPAKKKKVAGLDSPGRWDLVLVGEQGLMLFQRGNTNWIVTPSPRLETVADVPRTIPRVPNEDVEWVQACQGGSKPLSSFDYSGPLTEMVLLGNLAVRLGKPIEWDAGALKAINAPEAEPLIRREYRSGWELDAAWTA